MDIILYIALPVLGVGILALNRRCGQLREELHDYEELLGGLEDRVDSLERREEVDNLEERLIDLETLDARVTDIEDREEEDVS